MLYTVIVSLPRLQTISVEVDLFGGVTDGKGIIVPNNYGGCPEFEALMWNTTSLHWYFQLVIFFFFSCSSSHTGFFLESTRPVETLQIANVALMANKSYPKRIMMKQPQGISSIPYYGDIKWTSPQKEEVSCQWWNLNI